MRNTPPSAAQPSFGPATAAAPATAAPCRKWRREKFRPIIVVSLVGCASTDGFLGFCPLDGIARRVASLAPNRHALGRQRQDRVGLRGKGVAADGSAGAVAARHASRRRLAAVRSARRARPSKAGDTRPAGPGGSGAAVQWIWV